MGGEEISTRNFARTIDASVGVPDDPFASVSFGPLRLSGPHLKVRVITAAMAEQEEPQMLGYSSDSESDASEITSSSSNSMKDTCFCISLCKSKDSIVVHLDHTMIASPHFPEGVFIMPLLYYHQASVPLADNKIYVIVGLIFAPTDTKRQKGQCRRVDMFIIDGGDTSCCELLRALGQQQQQQDEKDGGALFYERKEVEGEGSELDDVVPNKWYGKKFDFMPKVFTCYDISVV